MSLLLLSLFVLGCASTTQPASHSNGQKIRALYDAFGRGDIPAVLGTFDKNIVWNEADNLPKYAARNPYRGPQAILEGVFMEIPKDWNNFKINIEDVIDGGESVAVTGRYTATSSSTGLPLNSQFVHVWKLRDDKIVSFQQYADTAQFARVMGRSK